MNPSEKQSKKERKELKKQEKQKAQLSKDFINKPAQEDSQDSDINLNARADQQIEEMEVGFIIGEIQEAYYHSLKTILLRYSEIIKNTNSQIADSVVQNRAIGNVVLADDDQSEQSNQQQDDQKEQQEDDQENVYSILTVFSGKSKISKNIRNFVLKDIEKKDFPEQIINLLKNNKTSVILNERLPNLPAFVVNSYHEVFKNDMLQIKNKDKKKYEQLFSGMLLNISEIQFEGEQQLEKLIYSKFEDYQMCQRARVWWLGGSNRSFKKKADMRNLYYLIAPDEYFLGIDQIKTYLQD